MCVYYSTSFFLWRLKLVFRDTLQFAVSYRSIEPGCLRLMRNEPKARDGRGPCPLNYNFPLPTGKIKIPQEKAKKVVDLKSILGYTHQVWVIVT